MPCRRERRLGRLLRFVDMRRDYQHSSASVHRRREEGRPQIRVAPPLLVVNGERYASIQIPQRPKADATACAQHPHGDPNLLRLQPTGRRRLFAARGTAPGQSIRARAVTGGKKPLGSGHPGPSAHARARRCCPRRDGGRRRSIRARAGTTEHGIYRLHWRLGPSAHARTRLGSFGRPGDGCRSIRARAGTTMLAGSVAMTEDGPSAHARARRSCTTPLPMA